ncbi:zinc finger, PMZ-type containing protein [Tanacetum coccineum]|uniref:Zinc finger, PMZ-type containing protein n=1 Tax=Tanacetum coccineum TaxID=301880 RepID=A0ABQ5J995_9ASTR
MLVLVSPTSMYYKIPSDPHTALILLKTDEDLCSFVKACDENNLKIDLFTERNDYDIMEMIAEEFHPKKPVSHVDSDVETNHPLDDVAYAVEQFEHEDEGNVNIHRMTTDDPWLNKLVGNDTFIGQTKHSNPNLQGRFLLEVRDPDDEQVEYKFKAKKNVSYPSFNPKTPWNECKPVLVMRFKSPRKLKLTLANYGVSMAINYGKKPKQLIMKNVRVANRVVRRVMRVKQCALFDHEGSLVEYYSKLSQYRQAILDTNPGSTCELETEVNDEDGKLYFRRFYVCFHGVKHGWLEGCRKIIGLNGCFLTHICKGELLTAMGRDANNQMFPIAWVVVRVENNQNWCWFLSLLRDDLNLGDGGGISMISDGHKRLIQAIADWLPNVEHRQCTREVEVRRGDQSFGVNLHQMKCGCNMWQLSWIPCIHAMAGYMHMKMNPDLGVGEWCSQSKWYEAYQFSIKLVYGPKFWKPTSHPPSLPHIEGKMPRRLKRRIGHPTEDDDHAITRYATSHCYNIYFKHYATTIFTIYFKHYAFPTPSTSNIMPLPPTPSSSNSMPPPPTPSGFNTMPLHATPGSNTSASSNTMQSHDTSASIGTNKGKGPLIPKKEADMPKVVLLATKVVLGDSRGGSRGGASKRCRGSSKRGRGSNTMPLQGLRDESSDEEHQLKMDIEAVYEIKREQIENDEDDQGFRITGSIGQTSNANLGVTHDAVMLRIFPITLTGAANRWVDRLSPRNVDSWDLLKKAFIQRYCPPSKTAKQLEEIRNFKQEGDETLYQA